MWLTVFAAGKLEAALPQTTAEALLAREVLKGSTCSGEAACWWLRGTACGSVSRYMESSLVSGLAGALRHCTCESSRCISVIHRPQHASIRTARSLSAPSTCWRAYPGVFHRPWLLVNLHGQMERWFSQCFSGVMLLLQASHGHNPGPGGQH